MNFEYPNNKNAVRKEGIEYLMSITAKGQPLEGMKNTGKAKSKNAGITRIRMRLNVCMKFVLFTVLTAPL